MTAATRHVVPHPAASRAGRGGASAGRSRHAPGLPSHRSARSASVEALRTAPRREPVFDDELAPSALGPIAGEEAMLPFGAGLAAPSPHRLFGSRLDDFAVRPSGRGELPDPFRFGRTFVQALLEVLSGRRPVGQLGGHTSPGVQAGLTRDQARGSRLDPSGRTPALHSLRISEPADGVAEWCAIVQLGPRFRAMAGRLEGLDGRWRCTRLQVG